MQREQAPTDDAPTDQVPTDGAPGDDTLGADELAELRASVAGLDDVDLADRPAAFERVNGELVAALRAVDDE